MVGGGVLVEGIIQDIDAKISWLFGTSHTN